MIVLVMATRTILVVGLFKKGMMKVLRIIEELALNYFLW